VARGRLQIISRGALVRLAFLAVLIVAFLFFAHAFFVRMPGSSFRGALPPVEASTLEIADRLRLDVEMLAGTIGERHRSVPRAYLAAATYIESRLFAMNHLPWREPSPPDSPRLTPGNIIVEIPGTELADEIIVIGAHYDSVVGSPGANDNATGVAAGLALIELIEDLAPLRTLRFAFFVDEEPPYFQTEEMGSLVYAMACRERDENIVAMISLETMGWFSDEAGSQKYPAGLASAYPDRGDFIAFVGNIRSRRLLREVIGAFRETTEFPSEGGALPGHLPGIGWSDHWAFWQAGYPGIMITDTALFRYPYYHTSEDTPDKIDYERLGRVVDGLERVVRHLANREARTSP